VLGVIAGFSMKACQESHAVDVLSVLCSFETVVDQLKSRDSDELWVSLGACNIHDARMATVGSTSQDWTTSSHQHIVLGRQARMLL
jgi:hypothetical protein